MIRHFQFMLARAQRLDSARPSATMLLSATMFVVLLTSSIGLSAADQTSTSPVAPQVLAAQQQRMAVMERAAAATVAIFGLDGGGGGSGVIVSPDGYALTNYHVSSACGDHMRCGLNDGRIYDAVIVGVDATGDVSLIQLLGRDDFPTAPLADSDLVRVGEWCFAAGNPFVLATNLQPSISLGIVSGVGRYQYPAGTLLEYADCIQTDAAINPGNSGGPLFSMQGEVIGINGRCSFEKRGRVNVGVGYAISANQIKHFLGMLKSGRLVDHATLGATVSTDASGKVLVSNILSSSDAYRRGLRYGDEIIGLADREVRTTNHFKNILGTLPKDWRVPLVIRRDGKTQTLLVRLDGVHSEKQLTDLVNSEASETHGGPQPDPNKEQDKKDELDEKHSHDKQLEDDFDPQDPHDADSSPAPDDNSLEDDLGTDGPGTEPSDAAQLEPGQPNQALVRSMLIERSGFANYYYNQRHRTELWERCHQQSDFGEAASPWTLTGSIAGESTPVSVELLPDRGELHVGSRTLTAELTDRMSDVVGQRRETGLLVALHALQQFLTLGPERIGDTIYLGTLPVYAGTSTVLADAPRQAVLQTLWYDAKVRFSFDSTTGLVSLVEVFGDTGQDPVELYVDQYAPLVVGAESKPLLPSRIRLQYGTEPRLLLSIDSVTLGEAAKLKQVAPGAQPAALPAASPAIDQQTRRRGRAWTPRFVATQSPSSQEPVATTNGIQANAEQPAQAKLTALHNTGSIHAVAVATELNTVKLYGAGGVANLDAYQSGFFISAAGHVLTSWSTVLDVDTVFAVTSDGGRYEAKVLGIDPNLEIAVLATGQATSHFFDLQQTVDPPVGSRVLAFSNLYGIATGSEMSSVQKGVIMARTELNARRGSFASVYQGPVFIIDAMTNNPGAAGGALTTFDGRLVGMLGKEMRDASSNTWLNYAIPIDLMKESIERLLSGKSIQRTAIAQRTVDRPTSLKYLGIVLVPNVLTKTPAFVDQVQPASLAAIAGLRNDDLILFINSRRVSSQAALLEELTTIDRADKVTLLVQRDNQLQEIVLAP
jgi:serine protease Do